MKGEFCLCASGSGVGVGKKEQHGGLESSMGESAPERRSSASWEKDIWMGRMGEVRTVLKMPTHRQQDMEEGLVRESSEASRGQYQGS